MTNIVNMSYTTNMKSIRYILTGQPHTITDCLDLAQKQPSSSVTVNLAARQYPIEQSVLVELVASYIWHFQDFTATCADIYGGFFLPNALGLKGKRIARADNKLQQTMEQIEAQRINIIGRERRFTDLHFNN